MGGNIAVRLSKISMYGARKNSKVTKHKELNFKMSGKFFLIKINQEMKEYVSLVIRLDLVYVPLFAEFLRVTPPFYCISR